MSVVFLSNDVLPYNRVSDKEEFVNCSNLKSISSKVLRSVYFLSLNIGRWRRKCEVDLISEPQLQIVSVFTQMTQIYAQSCDKSNTFVIITIKNTTW